MRCNHQPLRRLPFALLLALIAGLILSSGAAAQQATPIVSEPDQPSGESSSQENAALLADAPSGTVTRTASNLTPSPGDVVTFTSTISGEAPADTTLYVFNITSNTELAFKAFRVVDSINVNLVVGNAAEVLATVPIPGAFTATYEWDMEVTASPGTVITTASELEDGNSTLNETAEVTLTVTDQQRSGTIALTPSNATPAPGSLVTVMIVISGTGEANDTIAIESSFAAADLTVEAFRTINVTNLGTASHLPSSGIDLITASLPNGGAFSATYEIDVRVSAGVASGTAIPINSQLGVVNASTLDSTSTSLTVTSEPGAEVPLTATVTRTASNMTPVKGEIVTFTVSFSGTAPAGTNLELDDIYGNMAFAYVGFEVVSNTNLTDPMLVGEFDNQVTMTVKESGAFSAVYESRMVILLGAGETIVSASVLQDRFQNLDVISEITQHVVAAPGEPEPTSTPPSPTVEPVTPEPTAPPATSVPVTPDGSDSSSGQDTSGSQVSALPSTGNGAGMNADVMLVILIGAGMLAAAAAMGVRRHPTGDR